jgi:hypothetical protein
MHYPHRRCERVAGSAGPRICLESRNSPLSQLHGTPRTTAMGVPSGNRALRSGPGTCHLHRIRAFVLARTSAAVRMIRPGAMWMLAAYLAATAGMSAWAADAPPRSHAGNSVLRVARKAVPPPEAVPAEAPPQLLPSPKTSAKVAAEGGLENLPPASIEPPVAPSRGIAAKGQDESLDPGIRPIGSLTIRIAPPEARDDQGQRMAPPPDAARDYFAQQLPTSPPSLPYSPWMLDDSYGPPLNFCYRPLFFEEVNLERYGHSWGLLQPAVSAAKFYGNVALLPYRLATQQPCECTYHDHHFRPGSWAPREIQMPQLPFSHLTD